MILTSTSIIYIYMITLCFKESLWALIEFIYSSIFIQIWNMPTSQHGIIELSPATTSIVVSTYIAHILQLQKCSLHLFALGRGSLSPSFDQHFSKRNSFVSLMNSWHHNDFLNLLIFYLMFYGEPTQSLQNAQTHIANMHFAYNLFTHVQKSHSIMALYSHNFDEVHQESCSQQSETHQIIENRLSMKQKERKEKKNEQKSSSSYSSYSNELIISN